MSDFVTSGKAHPTELRVLPATKKAELRCGAKAACYDNRRCTLPARHDGWHTSIDTVSSVRWNNGSYEIETPTHKASA